MNQSNFLFLRINWNAKQTWTSPSFLGPSLRGMYGRNLRQLTCTQTPKTQCNTCHQQADCAYSNLFEGQTKGSLNYPPQFVIQPPSLGIRTYHKGEALSFNHLTFGLNKHFLPNIFHTWQQATLENTPNALTFSSIDVCDIYGNQLQTWQAGQAIPQLLSLQQSLPAPSATPKAVRINLLTPLYMREARRDIQPANLKPEHLAMGALRRSKLLLTETQTQDYRKKLPPQLLQAWARSLKLEHQLEWYQEKRWSHRQQKEIPVKGLHGSLVLSGNLEPFWQAIALTPLIGLGKFCNFGLGQIALEPLD